MLLDLDSLGRVLSLSRNRAFQNHVVLNVVSSPTPFILIMVPFSRQTQLVGAEKNRYKDGGDAVFFRWRERGVVLDTDAPKGEVMHT